MLNQYPSTSSGPAASQFAILFTPNLCPLAPFFALTSCSTFSGQGALSLPLSSDQILLHKVVYSVGSGNSVSSGLKWSVQFQLLPSLAVSSDLNSNILICCLNALDKQKCLFLQDHNIFCSTFPSLFVSVSCCLFEIRQSCSGLFFRF
mgnify:CR=1 FL=1